MRSWGNVAPFSVLVCCLLIFGRWDVHGVLSYEKHVAVPKPIGFSYLGNVIFQDAVLRQATLVVFPAEPTKIERLNKRHFCRSFRRPIEMAIALNSLRLHLLFMALVLCVASSGFAQAPGTQMPESIPARIHNFPSTIQQQQQHQSTPPAPQSPPFGTVGLGDGPIQAGDTVEVQVFDAPELSVKALVSQSGDIPVPLLKTFHIAGFTSIEAGTALVEGIHGSRLPSESEHTW